MVSAAVQVDLRDRKERFQGFLDADGTGTRATSSVRSREGLMEVEVHDVEVHLSGGRATEDRVEVRPVVIEEAARVVDDLGDLEHMVLEDPERVGIREHERES